MFYVVRAIDKPDSLSLRMDNRDAHLEFLKSGALKVETAGPLVDPEGAMRGSLLIVRADTEMEVRSWLKDDPYTKAGLFETVEIDLFRWAIGAPDAAKDGS